MDPVINIMRHESIINPKEYPHPVHIVGAGATGSHVFAALVNLGFTNIKVYDDDVVAEHNLANQIYCGEDVGKYKVDACAAYYQRKLGVESCPDAFGFHNRKVTPTYLNSPRTSITGGIMFLLTDTMESRKNIVDTVVEKINRFATDVPVLIIETRMASTHGNVFTINPFDSDEVAAWRTTLVDDTDEDNIEVSPCGTALSVGPTAALIANYAVWQLMQFCVNPAAVQQRVDLFFNPTVTVTSSAIAA